MKHDSVFLYKKLCLSFRENRSLKYSDTVTWPPVLFTFLMNKVKEVCWWSVQVNNLIEERNSAWICRDSSRFMRRNLKFKQLSVKLGVFNAESVLRLQPTRQQTCLSLQRPCEDQLLHSLFTMLQADPGYSLKQSLLSVEDPDSRDATINRSVGWKKINLQLFY